MDERSAKRQGARRGICQDQAVPELCCELHGCWQGLELPGLLSVGRRCGDEAVLVRAWEGADDGTAGRFTPLALVGREDRPPGRKVDRAAYHITLNAYDRVLLQGNPS